MPDAREQWLIKRPIARSKDGVVAAQNYRAAEVGCEILRAGGNAVDAAVATAAALAVTEPWMSGLGGCGYMLIYLAAENRVVAVDFGTRAPMALDPGAYVLEAGETDEDLFGWPNVKGGVNLHGPLSIGVPGSVAGLGLASERFGVLPWSEVLAPATALAKAGHPVDWWSTLKVAGEAAVLRLYSEAAATYLPGGLPSVPADIGNSYLNLGNLANTLEQLTEQGFEDFYKGDLARALAKDLSALDAPLGADDLAGYEARITEPQRIERRGATLHLLRGLNAGPTFADALSRLPDPRAGTPDSTTYRAYGQALLRAYEDRLARLGHDGDLAGQGSTTHLCAVDKEGNMVTLTNTLLSLFGSKVILPESGVLMNNGIMWFDPRPGRPNSIAPGVPPLCNICPVLVTREDKAWFALGASGGRRILPAVFQMTAFLLDCELDLEAAVHQPRLNVDGRPLVEVDPRLGRSVLETFDEADHAIPMPALVQPNHYANPVVVAAGPDGFEGAAQIPAPFAAALGV